MPCDIYNIYELIDTVGEEPLQSILSQFSCPMNAEIENFVKHRAIDFAKRKAAVTYLITNDDGNVAAMFALTHKAVSISGESLSKSTLKRLSRYAQHDPATNTYTTSAFLIAQFGKNYANGELNISGDYMMGCALKTISSAQRLIGGGVVYLECEESIPRLREFYSNEHNQFVEFGRRQADDGIVYLQMMRII